MALFQQKRCILLIGDDGVSVYESKSHLRFLGISFWQSPEFESQLRDLLKPLGEFVPVYLLHNKQEQYFRNLETLPSSLPLLDRDKIIANKLQAVFPDAAIRGSVLLKDLPKTITRKEGEAFYLFSAVPYSDFLIRLFSVLEASMVPVQGMGVSPIEATDMLRQLFSRSQLQGLAANSVGQASASVQKGPVNNGATGKVQNWQIMIGQSEAGALRLICVCDGMLAFNRVSTVSDIAKYPELWAKEVMHELTNLCAALPKAGFRNGDRLGILTLAAKPAQKPLKDGFENLLQGREGPEESDLPQIGGIDFEFIDTVKAAQRLNLKLEEEGSRYVWDSLLAAWVGKKGRLTMPLRPPEIEQSAKPRRAFGWMSTAILVVLALGIQSVVTQQSDIDKAQGNLDQLALRLSDLKSNMEQSRQALAALGNGNIEALTLKKKIADAVEEGQDKKIERIAIAVETANLGSNISLRAFSIRKAGADSFEAVLSLEAPNQAAAENALETMQSLLRKALPGWQLEADLALQTSARIIANQTQSGVLDRSYQSSSLSEDAMVIYRLNFSLKSEVS